MPHSFKAFEAASYPAFFLSAEGKLFMNDAARNAGVPFSDEVAITRLLTVAFQEYYLNDSPKVASIPLLSDALNSRNLTVMPLDGGLLAVAGEERDDASTAFSSQMREPLSNIFATLPLISKRLDDPDLRFTDEIQANCYQLLRLASNLENAARIEQQHYSLQPVDLSALVESLCFCVDSICKDSGVPIDWQLPGHPLPVRADARLLSEAILNLIRNSLQYTRDGNHILVTLKEVGGKALLSVEDKGLGILPENLPRIFEPYFSTDPYGDSMLRPGLGLGLAVVRQTVAGFGGSVNAESRFGEGTNIFVALPLNNTKDELLGSDAATYLLNRYSPIYVQLCGYCRLPGM